MAMSLKLSMFVIKLSILTTDGLEDFEKDLFFKLKIVILLIFV